MESESVDTSTEEWLERANVAIKLKGCPMCGSSDVSITRQFVSKPIGSFSLAGMQIKTTGSFELLLKCADCGTSGVLTPE